MATGTQGNGPSTGNDNRNRNTLRNIASKKGAPPLGPSQGFGYATQIAGLQQNLAAAMALQQAQIAAARGDWQSARALGQQTRIEETAGAVNAALERGIVGSSIDLGNRAQAITNAAAQVQAARTARDLAIAQARVGGMQGVGAFYTGLGQVQAEKANAQAELAIQQYQTDQFDVLNQNFKALRASVLAKLRAKGRRRDVMGPAAPGPYKDAQGNTIDPLTGGISGGVYGPPPGGVGQSWGYANGGYYTVPIEQR